PFAEPDVPRARPLRGHTRGVGPAVLPGWITPSGPRCGQAPDSIGGRVAEVAEVADHPLSPAQDRLDLVHGRLEVRAEARVVGRSQGGALAGIRRPVEHLLGPRPRVLLKRGDVLPARRAD